MKIEKVCEANFNDIPCSCRCCLYWQTTGEFSEKNLMPEMGDKKKKWFDNVTERFGSCLKLVYENDSPVGFAQYAPAEFFPRASQYASGPASENAVLIACLYIVNKEARGKRLGTALLENIMSELKEKGAKAVETFAKKSSGDNPSGPLALYAKHGFKLRSDKDDFPLAHLDL